MVGIPEFEAIKLLVYYLQTISLPESFYLYLQEWDVYFVALIIILMIGILFYIAHLLLKLFFFKYVFQSLNASWAALQGSYFFFLYAIVLIAFGALFWFIGLPLPDKSKIGYYSGASLILTLILGIASFLKEDNQSFSSEYKSLTTKILNAIVVIFLCLAVSFTALEYAAFVMPSDLNMIYGYISHDAEPVYIIGETNPISVEIGGPDTGLSVVLYQDNLDGLKEISSLTLYSNNSSTQFNDTLIGNTLDKGNYLIFLNNTTSMSAGHYKLFLENPKYKQINSTIPFSLSIK
jgi:hypothetical protein